MSKKDKLEIHHNLAAAATTLATGVPASDHWHQINSSKITEVFLHQGTPRVFFKLFVDPSLKEKVKSLFRGSRCQRAVRENQRLETLGFHTPKTLLWGKSHRGEWFITEAVNAVGYGSYIYNFCRSPKDGSPANWKHQLQKALGQLVGRLHKQRITHGDLRVENVLVDLDSETPKLHLIDNESNHFYPKGIPEPEKIRNLVQVNMQFPEDLNRAGRARLFKAYFQQLDATDKAQQKKIIREVLTLTEARLAKRNGKRFIFRELSEQQKSRHPIG